MSFLRLHKCTGERHERSRNSQNRYPQAGAELLVREKAHPHACDELAATRRRLPMTRMEPVMVVGRSGPVPLADVFEGRRMLIEYHFMWKNGAPHHKQCEGCTHSPVAMNAAVCAYLAERDVNYAAPALALKPPEPNVVNPDQDPIAACRLRMLWMSELGNSPEDAADSLRYNPPQSVTEEQGLLDAVRIQLEWERQFTGG